MGNKTFDVYLASSVKTGGIYHYKLRDGKLSPAEITPMDRPMYMVTEGNKMYILLRGPFAEKGSGLIVYDIGDDGRLTNPSPIVPTLGREACHILVDGGEVYCANYASGSLIKLPGTLKQHTGRGPDLQRQEGPHVHFVGLTPDKKYVCAADLGLDTVFVYDRDLNLHSKAQVPPGHGVRHLAFSGDGKWLFAANELKSTLTVFSYEDGVLTPVDTCSTLPRDWEGESYGAAIRVKDGFVYVSNRGHDSVAKLRFSEGKAELLETVPCGGSYPRDFCFAGDYLLCANQLGNNLSVFDGAKGFVRTDCADVEAPLCVLARGNYE